MSLIAWTLAAILRLVPEAPEQDRLAAAIASAAEERAILGDADDGRMTASLLVAIAFHESGGTFDCSRTGDNGHSVSCWGLWVCPGPRCAELTADPFQAARVSRDMLAGSIRQCRALPVPGDRLSVYATGKCQTNRESRVRWATAQRLMKVEP